MKEKNTTILAPERREDGGPVQIHSDRVQTRTRRILCDAVTLVLAFLSMSVLTVATIVFVVTTMAHSQVTPSSDKLYDDLAAHARQSNSRFDHWPYPDVFTMAPAFPADNQDEYMQFVYDQGMEPVWSR